MIRVTVELVSAIDSANDKVLGVMHIANDGKGTDAKCNYDGAVFTKPDFKRITREGHVPLWPRHSKTIWHLVAKMLLNMGYVK